MNYVFDRPCYKCRMTTCDGTCEYKMPERIVTDANGRKHITTEPPPQPQRGSLTREQATAIMRMARELEDTGRLAVLTRGSTHTDQEASDWRRMNQSIQCALQDYLDALVNA